MASRHALQEIRRIAADELALEPADLHTLDAFLRLATARKATVEAVAGEPRLVDLAAIPADAALEGRARAAVFDREMVDAKTAGELLGSASGANPRQYANRLRQDGALLGVSFKNAFVYPAFQFDARRKRIRPAVEEANRVLGAADDPWGVASWWVTPSERLGGRAPADLVGTREEAQVVPLARAVLEDLG